MTDKTQGCGGSGKAWTPYEQDIRVVISCPGCPDCTPKPPDEVAGSYPDELAMDSNSGKVREIANKPRAKLPASSDDAHGDCQSDCSCFMRGLLGGDKP